MQNEIWQCGKLVHPTFGYRDVDINLDKEVLFSLTSEMKASSRIDSYMTNKLTSGAQGKDHKNSVGALECYLRIPPKTEFDKYGFEYKWARTFKSQAICMHYCVELRLILAGCDNGDVVPILMKPEDVTDYTELKELHLHKGRVMGMWIDKDNSRIFSIGEDKRLSCYDFKSKSLVSGEACFAR